MLTSSTKFGHNYKLKDGRENYHSQKARAKRAVLEKRAKRKGRAKCFTH